MAFAGLYSGLSQVHLPYTGNDVLVGLSYCPQVTQQTQAEHPHPDIEDCSYGDYNSGNHIEPPFLERPCMSLGGEYRVLVDFMQYDLVACIGQVLYHGLQFLVMTFGAATSLWSSE